MSIEALNWAFGLEIEPQLKFTIVALANRADEEGMCYPGVRWIMKKTCYGERTVRAHLKELQNRRLLTKDKQSREDGGDSTNRYRLALIQPGLPLTPPGAKVAGGGAEVAPPGAVVAGEGVQKLQGAGADFAPRNTKDLNVSNKKTKEAEARFARFWVVYPRKVAKPVALRAWLKLNPDDAMTDLLIAAVERHRASDQWTKDGGSFIPHPTTWLHQRRWEDLPPEVSKAEPWRAQPWWTSAPGITQKGLLLDPQIVQEPGEVFVYFKERVFAAAGPGPWNEAATAHRVLNEAQQRAHA